MRCLCNSSINQFFQKNISVCSHWLQSYLIKRNTFKTIQNYQSNLSQTFDDLSVSSRLPQQGSRSSRPRSASLSPTSWSVECGVMEILTGIFAIRFRGEIFATGFSPVFPTDISQHFPTSFSPWQKGSFIDIIFTPTIRQISTFAMPNFDKFRQLQFFDRMNQIPTNSLFSCLSLLLYADYSKSIPFFNRQISSLLSFLFWTLYYYYTPKKIIFQPAYLKNFEHRILRNAFFSLTIKLFEYQSNFKAPLKYMPDFKKIYQNSFAKFRHGFYSYIIR